MEYIVILIILLILIIILKYLFDFNLKKIKTIAQNDRLDEVAKKYPTNIEICKDYLKMLKNESVKIEENENAQTSLYIAISNKISIANITKSYTRIQTIAHECLHSIQDKKLLIFNFIYTNIYLLYFIIISILAILKLLPFKPMFLNILTILGLVYYSIRTYLENDAMIKARYLAKEYMEQKKISSQQEIDEIITEFDNINNVGIKCTNYSLLLGVMTKIIIFLIICICTPI